MRSVNAYPYYRCAVRLLCKMVIRNACVKIVNKLPNTLAEEWKGTFGVKMFDKINQLNNSYTEGPKCNFR